MNDLILARKLANYINQDERFIYVAPPCCPYGNHMGALLADVILQSGLNYETVVYPRVKHILLNYPEAKTINDIQKIVLTSGYAQFLQWHHQTKINRFHDLLFFFSSQGVNTTSELRQYLQKSDRRMDMLSITGVGNKTYDYLLRLLGFDAVAVDRHVFQYVERVGIFTHDYLQVKSIVECAADLLNIPRRTMDYSLWHSLTTNRDSQCEINFLD